MNKATTIVRITKTSVVCVDASKEWASPPLIRVGDDGKLSLLDIYIIGFSVGNSENIWGHSDLNKTYMWHRRGSQWCYSMYYKSRIHHSFLYRPFQNWTYYDSRKIFNIPLYDYFTRWPWKIQEGYDGEHSRPLHIKQGYMLHS